MRTRVTSIPRNRATPAQTPAIFLFSRGRLSGLPGAPLSGLDPGFPVEVPHCGQYRQLSAISIPQELQYIVASSPEITRSC
jgi:hypothetical protein